MPRSYLALNTQDTNKFFWELDVMGIRPLLISKDLQLTQGTLQNRHGCRILVPIIGKFGVLAGLRTGFPARTTG